MKLLGIDYGDKRIGLALSDDSGALAFPHEVIPNDARTLEKIADLLERENIATVVLGESKNLKGEDNPIMEKISHFKNLLEDKLKVNVILEREYYTSAQAAREKENQKTLDASAAALILQSFIDSKREL